MALRENELARCEGNGSMAGEAVLDLRPNPARARWTFDNLPAADGNTMRCAFACSIRPLPDRAERQALQEILMGSRPVLTVENVVAHFAPTLQAAADDAAKSKGAQAWLAAGSSDEMVQPLKKAANSVAFSCGLEILPPYQVELESHSYQQQRMREMQRVLAEKEAAGQVQHVARATELLKTFQELRQAAPDLPVGRVLEQISPADRGQMLQTMLLSSAKRDTMTDLWAVAGPYLVKIDLRTTPPRSTLNPLPPTLGPLRSVQPAVVQGQRVLLVGARSGFMVVRPDATDEPTLYPDPEIESPLGFSRVIYQETGNAEEPTFVGCHGEAGIVRWKLGRTAGPVSAIRPDRFIGDSRAGRSTFGQANSTNAGTVSNDSGRTGSGSGVASHLPGPRNLQAIDERRVVFSVANVCWILEGEELSALPPQSASEIIAIVPDNGRMLLVHEDGTVCTLDSSAQQLTCQQHRAGRYRCGGALPWLGGTRLLLAAEEGAIECIGADDPLVTQYISPHRGVRAVAGAADVVAAVSSDRQRLVLWHSWEGRQPMAEVYLTGLTRHRIADVEFG